MESQDRVVGRVVRFLYDSLDRLRDVMSEVNEAISDLMDSLKRAENDLDSLGIEVESRSPEDLAAMISAGRRSKGSSRDRLIALLSGEPIKPEATASQSPLIRKRKPTPTPTTATTAPAPTSTPSTPARPAVPATSSKPPAPTPKQPSGIPKPPTIGRPQAPTPKVPKPPTVQRPGVPLPKTAPTPPTQAPKPPTPRPQAPQPTTTAGPSAGPSPGTKAPTISGLRDEMLSELKRLKSIMKGGK